MDQDRVRIEPPRGACQEPIALLEDAPSRRTRTCPHHHPDDWAKIAGKKGERIAYVKPLMGEGKEEPRAVERVMNTGQYL
jgi:hypothetical protein